MFLTLQCTPLKSIWGDGVTVPKCVKPGMNRFHDHDIIFICNLNLYTYGNGSDTFAVKLPLSFDYKYMPDTSY